MMFIMNDRITVANKLQKQIHLLTNLKTYQYFKSRLKQTTSLKPNKHERNINKESNKHINKPTLFSYKR